MHGGDRQIYAQFRIVDAFCRAVPRRFAYWIGLRVADAYWRRDRVGRRRVEANLRTIHTFRGLQPSTARLQRMARRTFQHFGKYLVDFFRTPSLSRRDVERLVDIEQAQFLEQACSHGSGVLCVTAHLGSWEIGEVVLSALGHRMHVVVRPERDRRVDRLFQRRREQRGVRVIPLGRAGLRVLRALRHGEMVALLGDRDYTQHMDYSLFFGRRVRLPRGPATLCLRGGVPLLPGFLLRQADDSYRLRFHAPIVPEPGDGVETVQAKLTRVLETEIQAHATQWFMFDDFWGDEDA